MAGLIAADEHFNHQVALPHAMVGTSDPSWRERYWLSIQDTDRRDTVLTLGLGKYPNQDVFEGFVVWSQGGRQRNLRLSRALSADLETMSVGPLTVEIEEPFERLRLRLEDNPSGMAFDLTWLGTTVPTLEERHYWIRRQRATYDALRYVQHGSAAGRISTPDGDVEASHDRWWSERDHSWGTRPLPRREGDPPGQRPDWTMLFFCPLQLPGFGLHLYLYEAEPGRPVHLSGTLTPRLDRDGDVLKVTDIEHDLRFVEGAPAPTLAGGELRVTLTDGRTLAFEIIAHPGRAHLRGGGYEGWDGWYQGHWKGDDRLDHEVWDLTDDSQFYRYAKAGSDHLLEVHHDGQVGYGVMEYMVLRDHPVYGYAVPPRRSTT